MKTEQLSLFNKKGKEKEKKSQKLLMKRGVSEKTDITQSFYEGFDLSIIEKKDNFNIYSLISLTSSQKAEAKINLKEEKEEEISEKAIHSIVNKYCEIKANFENKINRSSSLDIKNINSKAKKIADEEKKIQEIKDKIDDFEALENREF